MVKPSPIVESLPRSGIREIMELAWTVPDVIHLEVGEPNFDTPAHVVEAAHRAARDGFTRYTPNAGIPELREVLAEKVRNRNHIEAEADRIVVTPGAVVGIYSTLAAAAEAGSEMLLSDPAWPNYQLMTRLLGVNSVRYPLAEEDDFIPNAARIEPHITDRTKVLLLNSPGNPTGATTPKEALMELMELAKTYDLWVLSDEVYDEIWFDSPHVSAGPFDPDGRVVTFFSFSKTYAMTGWRVGY
ncbi:MAG: aminotransferase class I/II-fold pyridoxal phosphate-dependent enzyme, partial [Acidimicrobiia bacterium]|nr:aminotransferase class I/II-fold pyridoxal phosphate-dependent enzyme [Acidimicrobiia bacterium]